MTIETLPVGCPWSDFLPPTISFCEKNLCSIITTPANTWSNLGYIVIGIYLGLKSKEQKIPAHLKLISIAAILTGIASFLYHASFTFFFQFFDLSAMYLFSSLLIVLNYRRLKATEETKVFYGFIGLVGFSMAILYIFKSIGIIIFGLHIVVALFLEWMIYQKCKMEKEHHPSAMPNYTNFLIALFCFALAFGIWILDFKKIVCDPDNHILQGHAIWHILTAFCYLYLYRFYSEMKNDYSPTHKY